ncbi:MAG: hypothetical protein AB7G52_11370 [Arcobacter sp.]
MTVGIDTVKSFSNHLQLHSVSGFLTKDSIDKLFEYIYKEEQDDILDFLSVLQINLSLEGFSKDNTLSLLKTNEGLLSSDSLDTTLKQMLAHSETSNNDELVGLMFLLRLHINILNKYLNKEEQ